MQGDECNLGRNKICNYLSFKNNSSYYIIIQKIFKKNRFEHFKK